MDQQNIIIPQLDGISVIAVILIISFGVDRIVTGFFFLMSFVKPWSRYLPDPEMIEDRNKRIRMEKRYKLTYFTLAAILSGLVIAYLGNVRILASLGYNTNIILDSVLTGLILIAGADQVADFLKSMPGISAAGNKPGERKSSQPIQISGKLIIEGEGANKLKN